MKRYLFIATLAVVLAACGDTFYEEPYDPTPEPDAPLTATVEQITVAPPDTATPDEPTPSQIATSDWTATPAPTASGAPLLVCPDERLSEGICYPVYTLGATPIYDQHGNLVDEFSAGQEIVILWPCELGECRLWGPDSEGGYLWVAESALTLELEQQQ